MSSIVDEFDGLTVEMLGHITNYAVCVGFRKPDSSGIKSPVKMKKLLNSHLCEVTTVINRINVFSEHAIRKLEDRRKIFSLQKILRGIATDIRFVRSQVEEHRGNVHKFKEIAHNYYASLEGFCGRLEKVYGPSDVPSLGNRVSEEVSERAGGFTWRDYRDRCAAWVNANNNY